MAQQVTRTALRAGFGSAVRVRAAVWPAIPVVYRDFFSPEVFVLRSIFERLGRGLPARAMERKLRSLPLAELQVKLRGLLVKSGLSDEDIETFMRMDPRQALELLLGVMRGR